MTKKNVLWFSSHTPTAEQLGALEAKLGPITITQIDRTFNAVKELSSEIADADIIIIKSEDGAEFKFREWQRIPEIIVKTEHFA